MPMGFHTVFFIETDDDFPFETVRLWYYTPFKYANLEFEWLKIQIIAI